MKRILFIKLTSLGDLIHALPALTDASMADPTLKIDWMIDRGFSEVAKWHPAIDQIYTTSHRTWRKGLIAAARPIRQLIAEARKTHYDLVIDGQGNFKTALLSLFMKGPTAGFDRRSAREAVASFAYKNKFFASWDIHAIERLRSLLAQCLGYPCPSTPPDFGIDSRRFLPLSFPTPEKYLVLIHSASWTTKLWPEEYWIQLVRMAADQGYTLFIPWGSEEEKERASRIATAHKNAIQLPKLSLSEIGTLLLKAAACVSVDTGLSHLAAALGTPTLTLYGATDSGKIGTSGALQIHLSANRFCSPCSKKKCLYPDSKTLSPPCLGVLSPEKVFSHLAKVLKRSPLPIGSC